MGENTKEKGTGRDACFSVENRSSVRITDVLGVVAFDEEEILLETGAGKLSGGGAGLRITVLSLETGEVSAVGKINGVVYLNDAKEKRAGFFSRKV